MPDLSIPDTISVHQATKDKPCVRVLLFLWLYVSFVCGKNDHPQNKGSQVRDLTTIDETCHVTLKVLRCSCLKYCTILEIVTYLSQTVLVLKNSIAID